jgi:putative hydrolase of the HAD superfamily
VGSLESERGVTRLFDPHVHRSMFIFFDIDDTLIDHSTAIKQATVRLYERLDLSLALEDFVARWQQAHRELYPRFLNGEWSYEAVVRERVHRAIDADMSDGQADRMFGQYLADYEAGWSLLPDVLPCLDRLRACRLGVISNGRSDEQRRKLTATGIADRFEHIVISEDCGHPKPSAVIFRLACEAVDVPPAQAIYVGDHYEIDIEGARHAGLEAIWLDRFGDLSSDHQGPVISSLDGLASVLHPRTVEPSQRQ